MQRIEASGYAAVGPVVAELDHHLAVAALLAGKVPGAVWADEAAKPTTAVLQIGPRCYVGGARHARGAEAVRDHLATVVLPEAQASGWPAVMVLTSAGAWAAGLEAATRDLLPEAGPRQYYERRVNASAAPVTLPAGFSLRAADAALLADPTVRGLEALREEMCSERESVAAFLAQSFGVCAVQDNTLAGWCLSEYNLGDRCEVGIATAPPYQRRGLATALTHALLAAAGAYNVTRVGWHCWTRNTGSAATAQKAGFTLAGGTMAALWRRKG